MKRHFENRQVNSSFIMRLISLAIMLVLATPLIMNAQAGKSNFSGTWALNADKSEMGDGGGQRGRFGGGDFVAKQDANNLTVERTRPNRDGEETTTTTIYTLDGKESVSTTGRGESKSTASWSADGKSLSIATTSSFNGNEFTSTQVWTLTDAKTLTISGTRPSQDGEMATILVYDKK